jgi:cytochrome c2
MITVVGNFCAVLACFLFIGFVPQLSPWSMDSLHLLTGLGFSAAFVIAQLLLFIQGDSRDKPILHLAKVCATGIIACLPITILVLSQELAISLRSIGAAVMFVLSLLLVNHIWLSSRLVFAVNLLGLLIAIQPSLTLDSRVLLAELVAAAPERVGSEFDVAFSSLHDLRVESTVLYPQRKFIPGGALSAVGGNRVLLATGDGEIRLIAISQTGPQVSSKKIMAPLNRASFDAAVERGTRYFRVTDLMSETLDDSAQRIWVAHHHWNELDQCVTLQVSETDIDLTTFGEVEPIWKTRFETTPCLPPDRMHNTTGGRMDLYPPHSLLLSVGETSLDHSGLSQNDEASYGKILQLDRRNWTVQMFSKGHRNPQGLLVEPGEVWSTEHGPQGGDELNLVKKGGNYGWPVATYGTEYGYKTWPASGTPGDHSFGARPVYAWVPSIGVSNLIRIRGTAFHAWKGDLLVASLDGKGNGFSLFRLKIVDDAPRVIERIHVNSRVRDLVELEDGRIFLWDGVRSVLTIEPVSHVFSQCTGCHALRESTHGIGPDLWSVVGREVAFYNNYAYSEALQNYGSRWTTQRLDTFLEDPQREVPGTSMNIPGIKDPATRRAIILYLQRLPINGAQ